MADSNGASYMYVCKETPHLPVRRMTGLGLSSAAQAHRLARQWNLRARAATFTERISPAEPVVTELCQALVDGEAVDQAVRNISVQSAELFGQDTVMDLADALLLACADEAIDVPTPARLLDLVRKTHQQECAAALIAGQLRDPLTGLDAAGSFLSQLWTLTRLSGDPALLVVVRSGRASGILREMTSAISMASVLGRCPELLALTVLPGGVGLGTLRDTSARQTVVDRLGLLHPHLSVSVWAVPRTSLEDFARWLVSTAELPELADSGSLDRRMLAVAPDEDSHNSRDRADDALPVLPLTPTRPVALPAIRWHVSVAVVMTAAILLMGSTVPWLRGDSPTTLAISDISQLLAAAAAAVLCWRTSRLADRIRRSWLSIAWGCGAWAAGQLAWSVLDVMDHGKIPYPSAADIGFVIFPVGALLCLVSFSPNIGRRAVSLSTVALVTAFIAIYWSIAGSGYAGPAAGWKLLLDVAYPIGDIALVSLAYISVSVPTRHRVPLFLLAAGASAIGIADAGFTSRQASGYITGHIQDIVWVFGFVLLGTAALAAEHLTVADIATGVIPRSTQPPAARMITYLPLAVAGSIVAVGSLAGHHVGSVETTMLVVAAMALLVLQYRQVRENHRLLLLVQRRESQLVRQAFHDPLTGLANRTLFLDRLQHALQLHRRDQRPVGLIICALDKFISQADLHERPLFDQVVVQVADRLLGVLEVGDTLARFSDTEYAVLLENGESLSVVNRIAQVLAQEFTVLGSPVHLDPPSIGAVDVTRQDRTPSLDELIVSADQALSAGRRTTKRSSVTPGNILHESEL